MTSIAIAGSACITAFSELITIFKTTSPIHDQTFVKEIDDHVSRFKVWARYIPPGHA
jgi:hypothetical protein